MEEDVVFGMENFGVSQSEMKERLRQALSWTELEGMGKRLCTLFPEVNNRSLPWPVHWQRGPACISSTKAMNMLDRPVRKSVRALLNALRMDPGLTVVEVTHNF